MTKTDLCKDDCLEALYEHKLATKLYEQMKHGSDEHKSWLKSKLQEFFIIEKIEDTVNKGLSSEK